MTLKILCLTMFCTIISLVLLIYLIAILTVGTYSYILFFPIVSFDGGTMMSEVALMTPRAIGLYYVKIVKSIALNIAWL